MCSLSRSRRAIGLCLSVVLAVLVGSASAYGQSTTFTLSGAVVDVSGGALPDVEVVATHTTTALRRRTTSDAEGRFAFAMMAEGRYDVTARRQGFSLESVRGIVLDAANDAVVITIALGIAALNETVSVGVSPGQASASPSSIPIGMFRPTSCATPSLQGS